MKKAALPQFIDQFVPAITFFSIPAEAAEFRVSRTAPSRRTSWTSGAKKRPVCAVSNYLSQTGLRTYCVKMSARGRQRDSNLELARWLFFHFQALIEPNGVDPRVAAQTEQSPSTVLKFFFAQPLRAMS